MATIGFVACSKAKSTFTLPAAALYTSALFRKSMLAAIDRSDKVYILSAKHGLLGCNDAIEPYDATLKTMKQAERMAWGERTGAQLSAVLRPGDTALLFCGKEYLTPLLSDLNRLKVSFESPLGALSLGARLSRLRSYNNETELRSMAARFFSLMHQVWAAQAGGRRIDETNGRQTWPLRGVYFILDGHGVQRGRMPRIVRVGTHAVSHGSRTTLWTGCARTVERQQVVEAIAPQFFAFMSAEPGHILPKLRSGPPAGRRANPLHSRSASARSGLKNK